MITGMGFGSVTADIGSGPRLQAKPYSQSMGIFINTNRQRIIKPKTKFMLILNTNEKKWWKPQVQLQLVTKSCGTEKLE